MVAAGSSRRTRRNKTAWSAGDTLRSSVPTAEVRDCSMPVGHSLATDPVYNQASSPALKIPIRFPCRSRLVAGTANTHRDTFELSDKTFNFRFAQQLDGAMKNKTFWGTKVT
nr:hypothetical protein [Escherichia coli]